MLTPSVVLVITPNRSDARRDTDEKAFIERARQLLSASFGQGREELGPRPKGEGVSGNGWTIDSHRYRAFRPIFISLTPVPMLKRPEKQKSRAE